MTCVRFDHILRMNKIIPAAFLIVLFLQSGCYNIANQPADDFSSTLIVWDNIENVYHKLLFHTVTITNTTITGFSLNTVQMEAFRISEENRLQFEQMKKKRGINLSEVKCIRCHLSVGKLLED